MQPQNTQSLLANIQQQLATLSGNLAQPQPTPVVTTTFQQPTPQFQQPTYPDISQLVRTAVQQELSALGVANKQAVTPPSMTSITEPQPTTQQGQQEMNPLLGMLANQSPMASILPIIGNAFTESQQEWLSHPNNLMGLPGFLMSKNGKAALNVLLDEYQTFCGVK